MTTAPYQFMKDQIPGTALDQGVHWYDKSGKLFKITEMDPFHARGALRKLFGTYGVGGVNSVLGKALDNRARQSRS